MDGHNGEYVVVRHVTVNRKQTFREFVLRSTLRLLFIRIHPVIDEVPTGEGENVEVHFFTLDYDPTATELYREYEVRGLKPDPLAQAKANEDDWSFVVFRPNSCLVSLKPDGTASFVTFCLLNGERRVHVFRNARRWSRRCYFGGVPKSSS